MDEDMIMRFLDKKNTFVVIGVSRNSEKYGHQVYKDLKEAGYQVYPVNPKAEKVLGDKCYPNLEKLPLIPDVVTIVVPPQITNQIVSQCRKLGIEKVWMQPGSESDTAIKFCEENNLELVHGICIMIKRKHLK